METGQSKSGGRVIKGSVQPVRRAVARLASAGEAGRSMRRIVGAVVVVLMATDAGGVRAGQVVVTVNVTLLALQGGVEAS